MKRLWLKILLCISFIWCQVSNPCADPEYVKIKKNIEANGISSVSERQWEYYKLKDQQCSQLTQDKVKEEKQIKRQRDNDELYCGLILLALYIWLTYPDEPEPLEIEAPDIF